MIEIISKVIFRRRQTYQTFHTVENPKVVDYARLHPNDQFFTSLPDGSANETHQILDTVPDEAYRQKFRSYIEKGAITLVGTEVHRMGETTHGIVFDKGKVDPSTGWTLMDLPWGRAGDELLWITRELAGWKDPSGLSGNEDVKLETVAQKTLSNKKEKERNPYAPRLHRR